MTDSTATHDIVFIDSRVQDAATLLRANLAPGSPRRQPRRSGKCRSAGRARRCGLGAGHRPRQRGAALAGQHLSGQSLQRPEVQAQLAALGQGLTADGDLLVYACNTAQGSEGAQFVSALAALTGPT